MAIVNNSSVVGTLVSGVPLTPRALARLRSRSGLDSSDRLVVLHRGRVVGGPSAPDRRPARGAGSRGDALGGRHPLPHARHRPRVEESDNPALALLTPQDEIDDAVMRADRRLLIGLLVSLLLIGLVAYAVGRSIVASLDRLATAANAIARGRLDRGTRSSGAARRGAWTSVWKPGLRAVLATYKGQLASADHRARDLAVDRDLQTALLRDDRRHLRRLVAANPGVRLETSALSIGPARMIGPGTRVAIVNNSSVVGTLVAGVPLTPTALARLAQPLGARPERQARGSPARPRRRRPLRPERRPACDAPERARTLPVGDTRYRALATTSRERQRESRPSRCSLRRTRSTTRSCRPTSGW